MAPSKLYLEKSKQACNAMKRYDISPSTVRSTLKHLLKAYEKNWKYIEEDDYKVLLDAILEPEGPKEMEIVEHGFVFIDEPEEEEEEEEPLKRRPRLRSETTSSNPAGYLRENRGNLCLEYNNSDTKANKNKNKDVPLSRCSSEVDIASSSNGEVKFTFSICKPPPGFGFPSPDAVTKHLEDIYQEKFQAFAMGFSLAQVLKQICECFIEQGNASDHVGNTNPSFNNEPEKEDAPTTDFPRFVVASEFEDCFIGTFKKQQMVGIDELSCSSILTTIPKAQATVGLCSKHYWVDDITRGLEKREISLVNDVDDEKPPSFTYIKTNVNYDTANVKPMLASISDENSCPGCFGDCLFREVPCACAVEKGGEFAYTTDGLVDEKFLEKRIDITLRKRTEFIKECWYKCGCGLSCGNRVVQRGIQARLQVFMTREGKGWGLRTLEDLPKGTFVCEYVGEIVTNRELFERNELNKNEEHRRYSVLLDADWSSEGFLKDEEALCLDATLFGNVARFINHRCVDANMVEIPVEVESPDHHFYHHAFFTTREVKAMEELTWDYGIDFDDDSYARKAFRCKCGSNYCKAVKRYKRSRRGVASGKEVIVRVN
ncbi:putative histone-lysine N-methyltransferase chromatin remodeling SET family [Helianthus annuus]|uniref:Histone-lysine N-methyltransferase chromatin remodeling SET family n=1 Tax=Helianthus annuus TaxID=4232 RepID=A0A251VU72_HELAN|nr:probable inactive histone-lysine N-methyltransferase SUVR2 isoform X1 [Helianthus annuus]KAF5761900.1 putative histone-lysine N-methyltransferase chromatin remodeling SET family [Helianthus annuus]